MNKTIAFWSLFALWGQLVFSADFELSTNSIVGGQNGAEISIPLKSEYGGVDLASSLEVAYSINSSWQVSLPVVLTLSAASSIQFGIGPQFNFGGGELSQQYFATVRPGMILYTGFSKFSVSAVIGKRFQLTESVSYRPWIGLNTIFYNTARTVVQISPIAFSIHL